jgi:hypothetical protein
MAKSQVQYSPPRVWAETVYKVESAEVTRKAWWREVRLMIETTLAWR